MAISRSGLDALRGSIGMGQGNIRNQDTRSNDMYYNSPYNKGAEQQQPVKPDFANGGGLNQNPGGMQQQSSWNPYSWNGWTGGQTSNSPYAGNVGGGFQQRPLDAQQAPQAGAPLTNAQTVGQPGQQSTVNAPNASVPSGPTMPRFSTGTSIGNGRDDPRRFMQRPSLSMQQMQQFRTPYRQPNPSGGYPPADGTIDPIYPPQPQGA